MKLQYCMFKGYNLACRLIAVEWQQQLNESSLWVTSKLNRQSRMPIIQSVRPSLTHRNYHNKSPLMCCTLESLRDRYSATESSQSRCLQLHLLIKSESGEIIKLDKTMYWLANIKRLFGRIMLLGGTIIFLRRLFQM
jgi:hypothetical protein